MKSTSELQAELEAIIAWFESDQADIDKSADQYKHGMEIAKELESRLKVAENTITKLKQSFADN